jgi:hypothetical protein
MIVTWMQFVSVVGVAVVAGGVVVLQGYPRAL